MALQPHLALQDGPQGPITLVGLPSASKEKTAKPIAEEPKAKLYCHSTWTLQQLKKAMLCMDAVQNKHVRNNTRNQHSDP